MSRRDDQLSLTQMLEHAHEACGFIEGRSRSDLDSDRLLTLGLERVVMIIGEAATRVSEATRSRHPDIPWAEIIGLRNRLTHGYDKVDLDILWVVLSDDLPPLIRQLEAALAERR